MPLTTDNTGAALIGGRAIQMEIHMKITKVVVLRPFYYNREIQALGRAVELPSLFAEEMIAAKKADRFIEVAPVVSPSSSHEVGRRAGKREDKDVRE